MVKLRRHGQGGAARRPLAREAGYNLVFLIVLISLLSVMAAAVLPSIKKQIQREREAELIFRGLQYAEAIRVFQQRFGRYPNSLDELLEVEPRSIRQLWVDPMTGERDWALVLAGAGQQRPNGDGDGDAEGAIDGQGRELVQASAPTDSFSATGGQSQQTTGPILGVVSRHKGLASRIFLGKEFYQEWRFTANILPKPQVVPDSNVIRRGSVADLGKPFPRGLTPLAVAPQEPLETGGSAPQDAFAGEDDG